MSMPTPCHVGHSSDDEQAAHVNLELVGELVAAGAKSMTGSIEVSDKVTKVQARMFLYEGGLYAIDLGGYARPVFARLRSSGIFATRNGNELAVLTRLDIPDPLAVAQAVGRGWLTIEALANVHQEMLLAALGAVLTLPKAKARTRKGQTSSRFCTLPLPVETLVDTVRMRADRLHSTWSMLSPDAAAGASVLRHTPSPLVERTSSPEVSAMAQEVDGVRGLDAVAHALGFSRAEAVHVASVLVRSGLALVDADAIEQPSPTQYLVPEAFGTHRITPVAPIEAERVPLPSPQASTPTSAPTTVLPLRPVDDVGDRERRLESLRPGVARLQEELQACVRAEQEAINQTAEASERLRAARVTLAHMEVAEAVPLGIA